MNKHVCLNVSSILEYNNNFSHKIKIDSLQYSRSKLFICFNVPGIAPLPLAAATRAIIPPVRTIPDDGSWHPNKYDPVEVPLITPVAAPLAAHLGAPVLAAPGIAPWGVNPWGQLVL